MSEVHTSKRKRTSLRAFLISLVVLILCSVVNWGVVSDWGNVRITNVTVVGDDGKEYTALMYVPDEVSNENPAPAVMCCHGYSGNARNHESWAVEYARRGYIVLSYDNAGSGDGEARETVENGRDNGMLIPDMMLTYLESLPIVDQENIAVAGHSGGCNAALNVVPNHNVKVAVMADPAVFFVPPNLGGDFETSMLFLLGTADKVLGVEDSYTRAAEMFAAFGAEIDPKVPVETGVTYTNESGAVYEHKLVEGQIHEGAFIDTTAIGYQLDFVQSIIEAPNPIEGTNQVWMWKDVMGLLGCFAFAVWLCCTVLLLMDYVPVLGTLRQPLPRNIGLRGPGLAISTIAAVVFPIVAIYFGGFGILKALGATDAYTNVEYGIFRLRFTNIAIGVVIALTIMGLLMLCLYLVTDGRKHKATLYDLGLTTEGKKGLNFKQIGLAFFLACLVIFIGWSYLSIQRSVLSTDFYCLFFGLKAVASRKLVYYIPYVLIWMVCFVGAAISMNVERRLPSTGNEKLDTAIAVVFNGLLNCLGITIIILIENYLQIQAGAGASSLEGWGTDVTRLWGMPLGMFIGGAGSTYCYRKTGSVWLGAFLFGAVAALMSCTFGQVHVLTEIPFDPTTMFG